MVRKILVRAGEARVEAELADTSCARSIADALPITGRANTWGEEIYFDIGIDAALDETAKEVVELGDIGFWPTGNAICFFFGRTPMSQGDEIRPASAVNIVGKMIGELEALKSVKDGAEVVIERRE